jgi:hypothetical protein
VESSLTAQAPRRVGQVETQFCCEDEEVEVDRPEVAMARSRNKEARGCLCVELM